MNDMGLRKGQTPKNFTEMQKRGWKSNIGRKPWNNGKKGVFSKETIKKMRLSKLSKPRSGNPENWKQTEETKEKCRKANLGKHFSPKTEFKKGFTGRLSGHWKGGITNERKKNNYYCKTRRLLEYNSEGSHTIVEWELLKKQYGYTCPSCKNKEPNIKLTEDHIIPLKKGGSDYIENIQPLCRSCNCKKHTTIKKY
jgi:5-methylcytosine-specific restriction endonuclease McrA